MQIKEINQHNRPDALKYIRKICKSSIIVINCRMIDTSDCDGFVCYEQDGGEICGIIIYIVENDDYEVVLLDAGGSAERMNQLLDALTQAARESVVGRLYSIVANDSTGMMIFLQRYGFEYSRIIKNSIALTRKFKPSIPDIGLDGIPLRHEIEFELNLDNN